jgi:hypothetical protein
MHPERMILECSASTPAGRANRDHFPQELGQADLEHIVAVPRRSRPRVVA